MTKKLKINEISVSSRDGNGGDLGAIIIKHEGSTKEVKAVIFSISEAQILNSYIDRMTK